MFTFEQYCISELKCSTQNSLPHSWFYMQNDLLALLTNEELSLVYVESLTDRCYVKVWYPKDKWASRPMHPDEIKRLMGIAASEGNMEEVYRLKQKLK